MHLGSQAVEELPPLPPVSPSPSPSPPVPPVSPSPSPAEEHVLHFAQSSEWSSTHAAVASTPKREKKIEYRNNFMSSILEVSGEQQRSARRSDGRARSNRRFGRSFSQLVDHVPKRRGT